MYITEIDNDAELKSKMNVFIVKVDENRTTLGLTTTQVSALNLLFSDYGAAIDDATKAKNASKGATIAKNSIKSTAKSSIAQYAKTWRANASIPDALLAELMLPPHNASQESPAPSQPTGLELKINTEGVVTLKWKRNGNLSTAIFIVESSPNTNGPWTTADITSQTKMVYGGTVGDQICFRVTARRVGQNSPPSSVIVLWPNGNTEILEIAA